MSISIGSVDFGDLFPTNARAEVDFVPGAIEEKLDEFHLVGVHGSYSSRGGLVGQNLGCLLRYRDSDRATVLGMFATDLALWTDVAPFDIEGPDGTTYSRCRYISHSIRNRGHGRDGDFFLIVEVQFRSLGLGD